MKSMTILWSSCTRHALCSLSSELMHFHLSMFPNIFFFVIDYNWVQGTQTFVPMISLDFVQDNIVILLHPEIPSSSFRFFLICTLFGYLQWRSVFKEHWRWTTWWSDSLLPNETLLVFCLCFPTRFLTQQTWFRNCILWEKKLLNYEYE